MADGIGCKCMTRHPGDCGCETTSHEYRLRLLLAVCYAGADLYGDDGEMQDNRTRPFIDFRRDTVDEIERKMRERAFANMKPIRDASSGTASCSARDRFVLDPESGFVYDKVNDEWLTELGDLLTALEDLWGACENLRCICVDAVNEQDGRILQAGQALDKAKDAIQVMRNAAGCAKPHELKKRIHELEEAAEAATEQER